MAARRLRQHLGGERCIVSRYLARDNDRIVKCMNNRFQLCYYIAKIQDILEHAA